MREGVEEYKQDDIWQISGWEDCIDEGGKGVLGGIFMRDGVC